MSPDIVNGAFEFTGGLFLLLNCWRTIQAKTVKGVSILTTTFFASWGFWNLWYYPSLNQFWSFAGGCVIVAANVLWIWLMIYYTWWAGRFATGGILNPVQYTPGEFTNETIISWPVIVQFGDDEPRVFRSLRLNPDGVK